MSSSRRLLWFGLWSAACVGCFGPGSDWPERQSGRPDEGSNDGDDDDDDDDDDESEQPPGFDAGSGGVKDAGASAPMTPADGACEPDAGAPDAGTYLKLIPPHALDAGAHDRPVYPVDADAGSNDSPDGGGAGCR